MFSSVFCIYFLHAPPTFSLEIDIFSDTLLCFIRIFCDSVSLFVCRPFFSAPLWCHTLVLHIIISPVLLRIRLMAVGPFLFSFFTHTYAQLSFLRTASLTPPDHCIFSGTTSTTCQRSHARDASISHGHFMSPCFAASWIWTFDFQQPYHSTTCVILCRISIFRSQSDDTSQHSFAPFPNAPLHCHFIFCSSSPPSPTSNTLLPPPLCPRSSKFARCVHSCLSIIL